MDDDRKGKGRARPEKDAEDHQPPQDDTSQGSMLSRVAASASGLTRNAFAAPSANELSAQAGAVLANSGKGQSSSSSSAGRGSDLTSEQRAPGTSHQGAAAGSFRPGHGEEHVRNSENEFLSFLDGIDSFTPSGDAGEPSLDAGGPGQSSWGEVWAQHQHYDESSLRTPQTPAGRGTVAEQESRDGADVLALLSEPMPSEPLEEPAAEEVVWNLTAEQRDQIRAMTKDLFTTAEPHGQVDPYGRLNLMPNFEASNIMRMPYSELDTGESYVYTGLNRESFKEQWNDVLFRYTDEVWGDMLPLVNEARREVEEMEQTEQVREVPQAVRRLQAILQHLHTNRTPRLPGKQ